MTKRFQSIQTMEFYRIRINQFARVCRNENDVSEFQYTHTQNLAMKE